MGIWMILVPYEELSTLAEAFWFIAWTFTKMFKGL